MTTCYHRGVLPHSLPSDIPGAKTVLIPGVVGGNRTYVVTTILYDGSKFCAVCPRCKMTVGYGTSVREAMINAVMDGAEYACSDTVACMDPAQASSVLPPAMLPDTHDHHLVHAQCPAGLGPLEVATAEGMAGPEWDEITGGIVH